MVAPLSAIGDFSDEEKQIIFNRFRSSLNKRYELVSHKLIEGIQKHGYSSIDIEDCKEEFCIKTVLAFIQQLNSTQHADELFILQVVRHQNLLQFTIKQSSLANPSITNKIVVDECMNCTLLNSTLKLDQLLSQHFSSHQISEQPITQKPDSKTHTFQEISLQEQDETATQLHSEDSLDDSQMTQLPFNEEDEEDDGYETQELITEELPPKPQVDPYVAARDAYNQGIGDYLIDVTYALQIFRSGMSVLIEVTIEHDGTVSHQKIARSSGSRDFDETATLALSSVQFDPLPEVMRTYSNYMVILQLQNSR